MGIGAPRRSHIFIGKSAIVLFIVPMQPSRILPDLQCSLLCEEIRQEITGNFILIGIIDMIRVPQVPVTAFKLAVFNRWTAGIGQFLESVRLMSPDQTTVLHKSEVRFA